MVGFSSEFVDDKSSPRWRAQQVLGKPSVMPQGGASACAWSPKKENRGKQWIHVRYKDAMQIKQVGVAENFNCGSVMSITLIDDQGKSHKLRAYKAPAAGEKHRMLRIMMPRMSEHDDFDKLLVFLQKQGECMWAGPKSCASSNILCSWPALTGILRETHSMCRSQSSTQSIMPRRRY